MAFRFLHTSDLHLGKPFGRFDEAIRGRLREARHAVIGRLAKAARAAEAPFVLLAGDTFDAETPSPQTLAQALQAMAQASDLTWVLMPGNHDSLAATELWRRIAADAVPNVRLALEPEVMMLTPDVALLPAPCTQRHPGRDLTLWMDGAATPDGCARIGLAHGGIAGFDGMEAAAIIPPDRAEQSGLAYLGLGDWHGQMQIGQSTWYSGTPEQDSFKHVGPGGALIVSVDGAQCDVTTCPIGQFHWQSIAVDLLPGDTGIDQVTSALPHPEQRRDSLIDLRLRGRQTLVERAAIDQLCARIGAEFGAFFVDASELQSQALVADLDTIEATGALRDAAEALMARAEDTGATGADRATSAAALNALFSIMSEASS